MCDHQNDTLVWYEIHVYGIFIFYFEDRCGIYSVYMLNRSNGGPSLKMKTMYCPVSLKYFVWNIPNYSQSHIYAFRFQKRREYGYRGNRSDHWMWRCVFSCTTEHDECDQVWLQSGVHSTWLYGTVYATLTRQQGTGDTIEEHLINYGVDLVTRI